jgi:hypothetical protein
MKSRSDERRRRKRSIVAKARVVSWTASTVVSLTNTTIDVIVMIDVEATREGGHGVVDETAVVIAEVMVGEGGDRIMEEGIRMATGRYWTRLDDAL